MPAVVPLILKSETVERFSRAQRLRVPSVAVVYATGDGTVQVIQDGRPTRLLEQMSGRFRFRYEVDMADHQHWIELHSSPPAARGGIYHFETRCDIGFRVSEPGEVVRRNLTEGLRVVSAYLMREIDAITSAYAIEDAHDAQDAVNRRFANGAIVDGCVELFRCHVFLKPDEAARAYLTQVDGANRSLETGGAQHMVDVQRARQDAELNDIAQSSSLRARERERAALGDRPMSLQDMIALHLERHPDDTAGAMAMIAQIRAAEMAQQEADRNRNFELLRQMDPDKLLMPGDPAARQITASIAEAIGGRSGHPVASIGTAPQRAADSWDAPLPDAAPPPAGTPPRQGAPAPTETPLPGIIPVYVAVDVAAGVGRDVHAIDAGIQSLLDGLARDREIAQVVRLGVVTFGAAAALRLPAQEPRSGLGIGYVGAEPGAARWTAALDRLAAVVGPDAEEFKRVTAALRRPQLLVLCAGRPGDEGQWKAAHEALTDRARNRYAPDIVACGTADTPAGLLIELTGRPETAFVAYEDDVTAAIDEFFHFALRRTQDLARAVLDGDTTAVLVPPAGYRPATELLDR